MKYKLFSFFMIIACAISNAQNDANTNWLKTVKITTENQFDIYNYAKKKSYASNLEDLASAIKIFEKLYRFDSSVYSLLSLSPFINEAQKNINGLIITSLNGIWYRKWDIFSTNMCAQINNYPGKESLLFSRDSLFNYKGDTLINQHSYRIIQTNTNSFFSLNDFKIFLDDKKIRYSVHIYEKNPIDPEICFPYSLYFGTNFLPENRTVKDRESAIYVKYVAL